MADTKIPKDGYLVVARDADLAAFERVWGALPPGTVFYACGSPTGAIEAVTRTTAREFSGYRVRVNAIAPGYTATDNTQALRDDRVIRTSAPSPCRLHRCPAARAGERVH